MKRKIAMFFALAAAAAACSCGSSSNSLISTVLAPADGATNQAIDVAVTATFSGDIGNGTADIIMGLFKDGVQPSLCTTFDYNDNSHVATCNHDPLESDASYTVTVAPFRNIRAAVSNFTTAPAPAAMQLLEEKQAHDEYEDDGFDAEIEPAEGFDEEEWQ